MSDDFTYYCNRHQVAFNDECPRCAKAAQHERSFRDATWELGIVLAVAALLLCAALLWAFIAQ